jgi:predicted DNA-binding protein YlxM (UPF0122 family)
MTCTNCSTYDSCTSICDKISRALHEVGATCAKDAGVVCLAGDPGNLYHPGCDESVCVHYTIKKSQVKEDVQINVQHREFSFSNEDIGRIALSRYNIGGIVTSSGYVRVILPTKNNGSSIIAQTVRHDVQTLIVQNPHGLLTARQRRAMRLYYGLIAKHCNSFQYIADIMGVSKMKAVHYVYVGMGKLRTYMLFIVTGALMNGLHYEFERLGIDIQYRPGPNLYKHDFDRVRTFMLSKKVDDILTREEFEVLWLFCNFDGSIRNSLEDIAGTLEISVQAVKYRIRSGLSKINLRVVDKILGLIDYRLCSARDCNNTFEPINGDHVYCSIACKKRERLRRFRDKKKGPPVYKPCEYCKIDFIPKTDKQRFCSKECRSKDALTRKPAFWDDITPGPQPALTIRVRELGNRTLYEEEECAGDIVASAGG